MAAIRVGVLGSTSLVGDGLLPLLQETYEVLPFSRATAPLTRDRAAAPAGIPYFISLMPIWALPEYFELILDRGARRIVALSSTSIFTKENSSDPAEQKHAARFAQAERQLAAWAESHRIEHLILRPTLIYGRGRDRNISEIARFIRRFGFFPLFGAACGLRQPIHADDVALACRRALEVEPLANHSYNISGGETLTYRDMVGRIFQALGKRPRTVTAPLWLFAAALACIRILPRCRDWSAAMAERMNQDLVFDHTDAERDLKLSFRPFRVTTKDLPG